jgi:hypothetical protein
LHLRPTVLSQTRDFYHGAEDVFELLIYRDQQLTIERPVEIRQQSVLEEAEKPEFEHKERPVTGLKLTEGLGVTETGTKLFEDVDWNEQRGATAGEGIMGMLACYKEILKEKGFPCNVIPSMFLYILHTFMRLTSHGMLYRATGTFFLRGESRPSQKISPLVTHRFYTCPVN